jgi:hypothetical protein
MTRLEHALDLARHVPVFPCREDKAPLTKHGFHDATTDLQLIQSSWTRWPDALIGVPTGGKLVVIDIDLKHQDAKQWYDEHQSRLRITRTHATRSGGWHLLFKPSSRVGCSVSKLGPHIDTRGIGGYIIWWPATGLEVLHAKKLQRVPEWVIAALHQPPVTVPFPSRHRPFHISSSEQTYAKIVGIVRTIATARAGERNALTYWGACRLAELVALNLIDPHTALDLVVEAATRTGITWKEARRTALSALRGL